MNGWPIKRREEAQERRMRKRGGGGNTKCQHKHKLISDAINVNKRSRLISQYICVCLYRIIHVWMTTRGSWHEHTACAQVGREKESVGEGGQASKAIKINNFQYFALMEKQRKTRASRVFSNEASDVTRPRNLNFSCNRNPPPYPLSSFLFFGLSVSILRR